MLRTWRLLAGGGFCRAGHAGFGRRRRRAGSLALAEEIVGGFLVAFLLLAFRCHDGWMAVIGSCEARKV